MIESAFIIGFGSMGKKHYEVLKKFLISEIVVFDLKPQLDSDSQNIIIHDVDKLEERIIKKQPGLVIIATNADSHVDYIKICLRNNISKILCEKPLCISLSQIEELTSLSKQYPQTKIAVNHQIRFVKQYNFIKKIIESKSMGKLCSIAVQAGNFGIAMNGTHFFELFHYLTDYYPDKVWAWIEPQNTLNPRGSIYKDYSGSLRIENKMGQRLYLDASDNQGHGLYVTYSFSYGKIMVDELSGKAYENKRCASEHHLPTTRYGQPSDIHVYDLGPKDIIKSTFSLVKSLLDDENYPTLKDGIMAIRTLIAAYASSSNDNSSIDVNNIPDEYSNSQFLWA